MGLLFTLGRCHCITTTRQEKLYVYDARTELFGQRLIFLKFCERVEITTVLFILRVHWTHWTQLCVNIWYPGITEILTHSNHMHLLCAVICVYWFLLMKAQKSRFRPRCWSLLIRKATLGLYINISQHWCRLQSLLSVVCIRRPLHIDCTWVVFLMGCDCEQNLAEFISGNVNKHLHFVPFFNSKPVMYLKYLLVTMTCLSCAVNTTVINELRSTGVIR